MAKNKKSRSIFRIVLIPLMIMFTLEIAVMIGVPSSAGIFARLNQNADQLVRQQVTNRRNNLETVMGVSWSNLNQLADIIDAEAETLMSREGLTMEQLQERTDLKDELLLNVADDMITEMYIKRVNGIYVVLNTKDLAPLRDSGRMPNCSGLCIQDLDPESTPSERYMDLMLKRAPISVVREIGISTDTAWKPMFTFGPEEDPANYDFLYQPYQLAYEAGVVENAEHYGYWTLSTSHWYGDTESSFVTYSQPLVTADGTVYGVLGVELSDDYLRTLLPYSELVLGDKGTYALAKVDLAREDFRVKETLISSSTIDRASLNGDTVFHLDDASRAECIINDEIYHVDLQPMQVYSSNTPFARGEWVLMGLVKEADLYRDTRFTQYILGIAVLMLLLIGFCGSIIIARKLSYPVQNLSKEVARASSQHSGIPALTRTGIREIDHFANAFTALSRDLVRTSSRFLRIIKMASSEIGGFEFTRNGEAFVTENFFAMLGMDGEEETWMSPAEFTEKLARLRQMYPWTPQQDGSEVYEMVDEKGCIRYMRVSTREQDGELIGLAEDVSVLMAERKRLEHDRDYDLLTGLLNRRAFYREVDRVFKSDVRDKIAAVIMLDLDELKKINDKFGHEWGDQYLRHAAWGLSSALPSNSLLARLSGDEFAVLMYGFAEEEEARDAVRAFEKAVGESSFVAPDEAQHPVKVSGGVAWYPKDGHNFHELMKYADFALYQVKNGVRGVVSEFDFGSYNQEIYLAQNRKELGRLLEERLVEYHFQPIFSAATGKAYAYEALMRVKMPTLQTPMAVLNLARQENRMKDIENLTMAASTETFAKLRAENLVGRDAYLFVNSIADQYLDEKTQKEIEERCSEFASRIVIEITEHNDIQPDVLEKKRAMRWFSGLFALDDYGTGYNGEKNLLELSPKFVKLDICLVRGIDSDANKQQIISNLLNFAHQRGMMVVAEGLETMGEIRKCLEMGVDLLQGYALARPAAVPTQISDAAMQVIREFHEERHK